ncbi:MAG: N,N-dimethylformamidase beta subunit family domain-containing protein, partial [Stellaceae bacterium]
AYNGWGGANLYGGNGPATAVNPGAAYAVSYNRPIVTRDGTGTYAGAQDTLFGAEYAAIYWLEENGYDVSYLSGIDTATNGSLLLNHKVFMDAGHDEYWTDSQVANVQAAVNAGVNLAFLSGNEMFWQTRLSPSLDSSATANRTLVSYKDTHYNTEIDPTGTATGTFEDPRLGSAPMPSNALTGTLFQVDQNNASSVITVPYGDTQLRFWRNTSVAKTASGQTASLESGLLGYEWDSSPDNGFMPAGLIDLSSTTVQEPDAYNTDWGSVDTAGAATHNLVEYRDPTSGALVFGAGTVFWSWGLSNQHDNSPYTFDATDPNVQQAMVNLLADMGVQPQTLQATLALATQSTDHTPPTSKISNVSGTNVVEGQTVTVTGTATDAGGGVIGGVQVSTDGGKTWHPAQGQVGSTSMNWTYSFSAPAAGTYTIESRAVDDSLNMETPGPGTSYTVTPSSSLSLFSGSAAPPIGNDKGAIEVGVKFTAATLGQITGIRFYKGSANTGTHVADLWTASGTLLASATFT